MCIGSITSPRIGKHTYVTCVHAEGLARPAAAVDCDIVRHSIAVKLFVLCSRTYENDFLFVQLPQQATSPPSLVDSRRIGLTHAIKLFQQVGSLENKTSIPKYEPLVPKSVNH